MDYTTGNPALPAGHPFTGVQSNRYWSSTTWAPGITVMWAWYVSLVDGHMWADDKAVYYYVWPVRGGL